MRDWQPVFKDPDEYRSNIVQAVLLDSDISAVKVNKKDVYGNGDFEVFVQPDDVLRAIKTIKDDIKFE